MTGTEGCPASPSTSACGTTRATTAATMLDSTMLVSFSDSFTPNWISSFPKKRPEPPIVVTAASVETLGSCAPLAEVQGDGFAHQSVLN